MAWASIKNVKDIVKEGAVEPLREMISDLNNFSNIQVGESIYAAEGNTDTLPLIAGQNMTISATENGIRFDASATTVRLDDVSGASIALSGTSVTLTWTDPENVTTGGITLAAWEGTKVVRKIGSAPTDETDGTVVVDSIVKNRYSSNGYIDTGLDYNTTYYYRFFPYTQDNVVTKGTSGSVTPAREVISTVPSQSGSLEYDGTEQTASFNNFDSGKMDVTGNTGTNADDYTATFTPKTGYEWADGSITGKEVTWTIDKQTVAVPSLNSSVTITYDGTEKNAITLGAVTGYDSSKMNVSGNTGTNAGSLTAMFTLKDTSNYEWNGNDATVTWTIEKAAGAATLDKSSVTLDTDNLTAAVTVSNATGAVSVGGSSDGTVATATLSGSTVTISHVNKKSGTAAITLNIAESTNYKAATKEIAVTASFSQIYGVEWDGTSTTAWTRTDAAAGFTDPSPAINNGTGSSPFDNISPWKDIEKVTDSEGGTLVKIPKFYYKLSKSGNTMKLQVSSASFDGSSVSPAHMDRGDGKGERDYVYVGRYHCATSTYKSTTGVQPIASITRATARTNIHNLGSTIWQWDYAMLTTIWMLYLVEFADWNSQAKIGYGCSYSSSKQNMGLTDSMQYHTGTSAASRTTYGHVQYRWMEDLWGNVYDWCDGIYFSGADVYAIKNPSKFSDTANGTKVGTRPTSGSWITSWAISTAGGFTWFMYPSNSSGGSDSTYICDYCDYGSSGVVLRVGGSYGQNQSLGLFYLNGSGAASYSGAGVGSRLQKLP